MTDKLRRLRNSFDILKQHLRLHEDLLNDAINESEQAESNLSAAKMVNCNSSGVSVGLAVFGQDQYKPEGERINSQKLSEMKVAKKRGRPVKKKRGRPKKS